MKRSTKVSRVMRVKGASRTPRVLRLLAPGRTLGDVARGTGVNAAHLSRIFGAHRSCSLETAAKISAYLGVTIDDLVTCLITHKRPARSTTTDQ